jgi:hypothetical protein
MRWKCKKLCGPSVVAIWNMLENPCAWPGIILHDYNLRYLEAEIGGLQFEDSKSQNVNKILSLKENPSLWRCEFKPQTPRLPKKDRKLLWLKELKIKLNRTLWVGWSPEDLPRNIFSNIHVLFIFCWLFTYICGTMCCFYSCTKWVVITSG